jgi:hypothetical protein
MVKSKQQNAAWIMPGIPLQNVDGRITGQYEGNRPRAQT